MTASLAQWPRQDPRWSPDGSARGLMKHKAPKDKKPHRHKWLRRFGIGFLVLTLVLVTGGYFVYRYLDGNIKEPDGPEAILKPEPGPKGPLNILLLGSDER